jgi:3alpha(or 20beta)-hydroxysteroid dehydrogenase
VEKFIAEGAKVLIWDIHETTAGEVSKTLPKGSSVPFVGDVSKFDDWQEAVKIAVETFGVLDVVVNNAGVSYFDRSDAYSLTTTSGCP